MSRYIDADRLIGFIYDNYMKEKEFIGRHQYTIDSLTAIVDDAPTADVVSREQYNELYEENLKLREEINNLAGEELPWAIVTVRTHNKGESPYRYHCPHCGYSHKKPSHYCSNCGRRCKE